jgi:hypothetical protein
MFSDLLQKCLDAEFGDTYPENGSFLLQTRRGRQYWYYRGFSADPQGGAGQQYLKYVGPKGNEESDKRVQHFQRVKSGYRERRQLASKLRQAGMPSPIAIEGQVVQALSKAGMFRLRSVLVGSVAFQTYGGLLGVRLPDLTMRTDDIDVAQYFSVSQQIDDKIENLEQALNSVDDSFSPVFHPNEPKLDSAANETVEIAVAANAINALHNWCLLSGRRQSAYSQGLYYSFPVTYYSFYLTSNTHSPTFTKGEVKN